MAEARSTGAKAAAEKLFFTLARAHVAFHKPLVIAVAGSIGKTSTKLALSELLRTEKRVSCMDDSYNNGLGLYLSVFELKVPTNTTPIAWLGLAAKAFWRLLTRNPQILIVEYGIDHPGDMDEMTRFIRPDISLLTAVTPEHMEYMKTLDGVGEEEIKVIHAAKQFGIINTVDVDAKYREDITATWYGYGDEAQESNKGFFTVKEFTATGAIVDFTLDDLQLDDIAVKIISVPLIRQLTGAALLARKLGIGESSLRGALASIEPAAGRMRLLAGVNDSVLLDDTANFSPVAGVAALQALKRIPGKRHIAILGNMHELGDYIVPGYAAVGEEFAGVDVVLLVGELSKEHFGKIATEKGFVEGSTLFMFDSAPEAGIFARDKLVASGDIVVIKGPFGGFYLEEATKKLLKNKEDIGLLTRQSDFWQRKKRAQFGESLDR